MVVSRAHWTQSTASRQFAAARTRRTTRLRTGAARTELRVVPRKAAWVPAQRTPTRMTVARFLRLYADDRRFIRLKFMTLAGLIITTALLERVV